MKSHITEHPIQWALTVLIAVGFGLALGVTSTGLHAQEAQLTHGDIESALTHPDQELQELREEKGSKHVIVVGIDDVIGSEQQRTELREKHGQAIEGIRQRLREDEHAAKVLQNSFESSGLSIDDVVAVHVATNATPAEGQEGEQKQEIAAHKVVYLVVEGSTPQPEDQEGKHEQGEEPGSVR